MPGTVTAAAVSAASKMFQQTFLQTSGSNRKPLSIGLSLMLQAAIIAFLALLPLLYDSRLPSMQLRSTLLAPLPPVAPAFKEAVVPAGRIPTGHRFVFHPDSLNRMVRTTAKTVEITPAPSLEVTGATGDPNGAASSILSGLNAAPQYPPPAPAKQAVTQAPKHQTIRLGSVLSESNLIHKVQPVYPPLARSARVSGTVEFSATISRDGRIENLQLLHGHPLLVNAAKEAILQWRYRPTMLNGQPVEVITSIIVSFNLN